MLTEVINTKKILQTLVGMFMVIVVSFFGAASLSKPTHAAPVVGFNPGNIISENVFTNSKSMTAAQIQAFLNSKVPSCDTDGTLRATDKGRGDLTHAQYAAMKGWSGPPFTCLKDYSEGGRVSAQIIYDAAQEFNINPQVLIVLLQKEQSLVTDTWPISIQYRSATGYGCPDSAPCDSQYYGLTNQIRWSARMFRSIMNASSGWYTPYVVGNNYIQYGVSSSCGGSTVNIVNRSTQALYNYTPYQPNQDSLNAGYGDAPGDCDTHGNRNFYLYFSDWFGSPQFGNLVRTADNGTVYFLSGSTKYPIASMNTLSALYPLGDVTYVSQASIDSFTTGPMMGRIIKSNDGTIYFYDAGIRLSFGSCAQVIAYGSSCGGAIPFDDGQINALVNGPGMTDIFGTSSGKTFYITSGTKREVYDTTSLTQIGVAGGKVVLNESALDYLSYGAPVIRSNVVVTNRSNGQKYLYSNNTYHILSATQASYPYLNSLPTGTLDSSSIPTGQVNSTFNGYIKDASTSKPYILMSQGKVLLTDPTAWGVTSTTLDSAFVTSLPTATDAINNGIVMTPGDGTVYYVTNGTKRPVPGWGNLVDLKIQPFAINMIDAAQMNAIPTGPLVYAPGHLVKTANSATVYVVKGYSELMPISSFLFPQELGASSTLETIGSTDFGTYAVSSSLQTQISCGGQNYVGINGSLYQVSPSDLTKFGFNPANFTEAGLLCSVLPKSGKSIPEFLLDGTGTIYQVQSGSKHAFTGYGAYLAHGGTSQNTVRVSNHFSGLIPNGANITQ